MSQNITGAQELELRLYLKNSALNLSENFAVFERRRMIISRDDFAKKLGKRVVSGGALEVRFLEISLARWQDLDESNGKCTQIELTYNFHVFVEFVDERANSSNSDLEYNSFIFAMRDDFLRNKKIAGINGAKQVLIDSFVLPDKNQFGNDTLTDATGHFSDLQLTVNFYI